MKEEIAVGPLAIAKIGGMERLAAVLALAFSVCAAPAFTGATVPWTRYEAEDMTVNGAILGPYYTVGLQGTEASGRKYAQLSSTGHYVEFTNQTPANALVVRYSVPDSADGTGTDSTLSLYTNGVFAGKLPMTSRYSWLYGNYPFTNSPSAGSPRNFYDEVRTNGLSLGAGTVVRLQKDATDTASSYRIDLVELENVASPLAQPANSLSIMNYGAGGTGATDDTTALNNCISAALSQGKSVWLPAGIYKITGSVNLPSNLTIQGAGMWHTTLVGDPSLYATPSRRITLDGNGNNIHLADFAISGKLNYRNDSEANDGIGGAYGTGSSISRIWVEHTKTGAWIVNSQGVVVDSCRFRNTVADGINLSVGMQGCVVTNCTARGTGDDCFAIWPATYISQTYTPGSNVITHCTGQCPFLANGGAIYGAVGNRIEDCLFQDLPYGCGILISTTFAVGINRFSGTTVAQRCDLNRCGGYDPGYTWRAALQLCLDHTNISGINLNNLNITNSVSDGLSIIGAGTLSNALISSVNIPNYGIGITGRNGLWARSDAKGSMTVSNCAIVQYKDDSPTFTFNFVTSTVPVTVQTSPAGRSFSVDATNYTSSQSFNWTAGSSHTIGVTTPQGGATGTQYVWSAWSDGGASLHTITPASSTNYTATFATNYYLTMSPETGGTVTPGSLWTNSGAKVGISATASSGYTFVNWTGSGSGSYSGSSNPALVVMNGAVSQSASFTTPKIIELSGNMGFGYVVAGNSSSRLLTVTNTGESVLTVSGISYPTGFSGTWSGALVAGGSTNVTVMFSPTQETNYTGTLTVNSDATGGTDTLALFAAGVLQTNDMPAAQNILRAVTKSDGSVMITYATSPGFPYHLETATELAVAGWTAMEASATNASAGVTTFTDSNPIKGAQRFYRAVSP